MADEVLEISVVVDSEAAEAVSELFNRYNGGDYDSDSEAGEAAGGGAVIEATGFDDDQRPLQEGHQLVVKTYFKPGPRGEEIRQKIEEGLWRLSLIYPMPEPQVRVIREEDWAHAWKKFYKPMRIGARILLKPSWEAAETQPDDIVIELDPGMAFGTGMHPSTRLCIAALEDCVEPGQEMLDVGTGSGILAVVAIKLGAARVFATDIDPLAVRVTRENAALNGLAIDADGPIHVEQGSVPAGMAHRFPVVVANILPNILIKLMDSAYGNPPLTEPLAPGGIIIMAGIIEEHAPEVIETAARYGLNLVDTKRESDWVALVFRAQSNSQSNSQPDSQSGS
ncbi:MAG: 50S ribosomal protein L11 methyltransferase [Litorilinea sp.]